MTYAVTRSSEDKTQLKVNGVVFTQAANGEGERIQEEIIKFGKGEAYVVPETLNYLPQSKCWTNEKGKIVLFNLANEPKKAVAFIKDYLTGRRSKKVKTDTSASPLAGVITTDKGYVVSPDNDNPDAKEAIKVDRKK